MIARKNLITVAKHSDNDKGWIRDGAETSNMQELIRAEESERRQLVAAQFIYLLYDQGEGVWSNSCSINCEKVMLKDVISKVQHPKRKHPSPTNCLLGSRKGSEAIVCCRCLSSFPLMVLI